MIQLRDVRKMFGDREVLAGVSFEVPAGGITALVGRSGVGKSVVSRCCLGLLRVDAGEVYIEGERIDAWPERRLTALRSRWPYVVQGAALLDWMSIVENVAVPLERALGLGAKEAWARAEATLEQLGLGDLGRRTPVEVGPGVRKRAAIARALALKPTGVLYDEPTTGLDASAARLIDSLILRAAREGTTSLVVTHDLASLRRIADRVVLLDDGRVAFQGSASEFFARADEHPAIRRFIGPARPR